MKRKSFISLMAVLAAAGALSACGGSSSTAAGAADSASSAASGQPADRLEAARQRGTLIVALEGAWSPWCYHDDTDTLVGYDVEVSRAIAEYLGLEPEYVEGEWDGLFAGLEAGRYDIVCNGVEVTEERAKSYDFSEPYAYIHTALAVREDNTDITSFEDLAGKTTANSIASTYMTLAESYGAEVLGVDTLDEDRLLEIRRTVGMVFQNPDNQIVANVVEEDVAFAPENLGVPPEEIRRRVDDALKAVGMYQYREHSPHLLSGGQKQRIAIAGVIAMEPRCIVLDEPTAMLDPIGRADVLRTIKTLNRERGVTVVLITHHMDEAAQADRLVVMAKGRIVADGAPKEVFQDVEGLKSVGLTVPDTTELLWELRREGLDVPLDALSDDECAQALKELLA